MDFGARSIKNTRKTNEFATTLVVANPFKNLVKINISIEKCAAGGSHSRPSPGLRQGPVSSDLHSWKWNPRQSLQTLEHQGKRDFQELPALYRLFCVFTCLLATDIPMNCIPESCSYQHKHFFLHDSVPAGQPDPWEAHT